MLCQCCLWGARNSPELCNGRVNTHTHTHTQSVNLVKVQSLCRYVETFRPPSFLYSVWKLSLCKTTYLERPPVKQYPVVWFLFSRCVHTAWLCPYLTLVFYYHSLIVCQLLLLIGYGEITSVHACMNLPFVLNSDFVFSFMRCGKGPMRVQEGQRAVFFITRKSHTLTATHCNDIHRTFQHD